MTSTVRLLAKRLIPPLLYDAWTSWRHGVHSGHIWDGVYSHYRDVPVAGEGWGGAEWLGATRELTENALREVRSHGTLPPGMPPHHAPLALLCGVLLQQAGRVCVLDVGGGMGVAFTYLMPNLTRRSLIDYHVVDSPAACEIARQLFEGDERIHFHESLPGVLPGVDVVYLGAMIQYVEDYRGFIEKLMGYRAAYVLFTFVPTGDIPTFATQQRNMRNTKVACWFFNDGELISMLEGGGYALVYAGHMDRRFDMSNFPEGHRIERMPHLLFARR